MASRFWVGGTGTWDNAATTHWSASSGGASGASAPTSADDATFDGNSGLTTNVVVTIAGTAACNNLTIAGPAVKVCTFTLSGNFTISAALALNGNTAVNRLLVQSSVAGTQRTITLATLTSLSNIDFQDIKTAGAAGTWTGTSLGDCQGDSGITFDTPVTQTYTDTGSHSDNWSTLARWTSRVPLPQDNVLVPLGSTGTITADMPRLGKDIDFTGFTGTAAFSSVGSSIFGSVTLAAGMTVSGTQIVTLAGRAAQTVTSATKTWPMRMVINAPGGTYTLQDAWSGSNTAATTTLQLQNGVLVDNAQTVTFTNASGSFVMSGGTLTKTGVWNFSATAAVSFWQVTGGTVNASGSIVLTAASANTRTFAGGGKTYGTLTYTVAGSTGGLVLTGANTFAAVNFSDVTNARTLTLPASTITKILDASGIVGTSGKNMTINSSTPGTQATLTEVGLIQTFLTITDLLINVQGAATGDTVSDADAVSLLALGTLGNQTDAVGIADAPSLLALSGPADTAAGTDAATSVGLSDSDTTSAVDAVVLIGPSASDTTSMADAPAGIGLGGVDDPMTLADIALAVALFGVDDPLLITEMARLFDQLNVYETVGIDDEVLGAALSAHDTTTTHDAVATIALLAHEVVSAADAAALLLAFLAGHDATTVHDYVLAARALADLSKAIRGQAAQSIQGQPTTTMTGTAQKSIQGEPQW